MKKNFLILCCFGFSVVALSQEITKIDSLKKELQAQLVDTTNVSLILKIANLFSKSNPDSSFLYYNKALELATKIESKPQLALALYKIAIYYENNRNYEKAIEKYIEANSIYEKLNNIKKIAKITNYIGDCYLQLYAEDKAIEYYLKSLTIYKNSANENGIASNYLSIGNLFYSQENYEFAKKYFQDALEIYNKLGDKDGISVSYTNLGNATADGGNNEDALEDYEKSIEIQRELNDQIGIGINYNNIGDCYISLKQYNKAMDYFFKSLNIAKKLNDQGLISIVFLNIADVQIQLKNYKEGILNAIKSFEIAEQLGDLNLQADNLLKLSNAYEKLGNLSQAFNYNKRYVKIKDSLLKIDKTNKVKLFQALNTLEKTQFTISELAAKNEVAQLKYENEKKFSYFLIIAMTVFAFLIILLILQQTSKKKAYNLLEFKNHQINRMNTEIQNQSNSLRQLNETKDKFFSIIAHDLRNPFNSIKGFTELLIENIKEYDEEKQLKFLKVIKGSTMKASDLLNNLLLWANNQSDKIKYLPKKIELSNQVVDAISILEIQAINKDIEIVNLIESDILVEADENMLATIFRNLISNAIKYTESNGKVEISTKVLDSFVEVTVKDNGIGMSQIEIDHLFRIEVHTSTVGTANEQGSGLGLILCKDFVEKQGGKIWVKSALKEGSEFIFTIPEWKE